MLQYQAEPTQTPRNDWKAAAEKHRCLKILQVSVGQARTPALITNFLCEHKPRLAPCAWLYPQLRGGGDMFLSLGRFTCGESPRSRDLCLLTGHGDSSNPAWGGAGLPMSPQLPGIVTSTRGTRLQSCPLFILRAQGSGYGKVISPSRTKGSIRAMS